MIYLYTTMANPQNQTFCYICNVVDDEGEERIPMSSLPGAITHAASQETFRRLAITHRKNARLEAQNITEADKLCLNCLQRNAFKKASVYHVIKGPCNFELSPEKHIDVLYVREKKI